MRGIKAKKIRKACYAGGNWRERSYYVVEDITKNSLARIHRIVADNARVAYQKMKKGHIVHEEK